MVQASPRRCFSVGRPLAVVAMLVLSGACSGGSAPIDSESSSHSEVVGGGLVGDGQRLSLELLRSDDDIEICAVLGSSVEDSPDPGCTFRFDPGAASSPPELGIIAGGVGLAEGERFLQVAVVLSGQPDSFVTDCATAESVTGTHRSLFVIGIVVPTADCGRSISFEATKNGTTTSTVLAG